MRSCEVQGAQAECDSLDSPARIVVAFVKPSIHDIKGSGETESIVAMNALVERLSVLSKNKLSLLGAPETDKQP